MPSTESSQQHPPVIGTAAEAGRQRYRRRPDLWATYPDPRSNLRATMYGLALDEYRAEYRRRQAEGWGSWELAVRFPAPEAVAS